MEINQNHSGQGDNKIIFQLKNSPVKIKESFKNSDQVRKFYKKERIKKIISYILVVLNFLLSPIYGYFIIKLIFKQ